MDASASTKPDANENSSAVLNFFLTLDVDRFPPPSKQKCSVVKYTKLPDFDFDSKVSWPPQSYTLKPRLRRIVTLGEDDHIMRTSRSLKSNPTAPTKIMSSNNFTKRKIVTISEDDEIIRNDLHPSFSKDRKVPGRITNRSSEADFKNKSPLRKAPTKFPNFYKSPKDSKSSVKPISTSPRREVNVTQQNQRGRTSSSPSAENNSRNIKEKEKKTQRNSRSLNPTLNTSISKNFVLPSESEKELTKIRNILYDSLKSKSVTNKNPGERPKSNKLPQVQTKPKIVFKEISKTKPSKVIHVPLDERKKKEKQMASVSFVTPALASADCASETVSILNCKDAETATDPLPAKELINQITEMQDILINTITTCKSIQTDAKETMFDSLDIPNVTLTKEKSEPKEGLAIFKTTSLPNLKNPPLTIVSQNKDMNDSDISFCNGSSYIISRATLTYTTRQKFNFQLVGNDDDVKPSLPPSPLDYPMSVVSVLKNEIKNKTLDENVTSDDSYEKDKTQKEEYLNHLNDLKTINCSYLYNKLMKPSDIISTLRVNNGLLQSDYICEQFQRELNFIDSFFESLQYLETCSLTDKCYPENKVENFGSNSVLFDSTFDVRNSEYDNFLSKLENGSNIGDTETMASKSLCLLNLLIRDEQRRAKNLLFVLKMREEALKDFTKSQILWLEKKKKHDNTDISTLKKKQRGALLKLQHECGEMQRMRKALLTLSEKRKVALMKTKKNIELKLKNNVNVEQIILGKKKLKRSTCLDRNASPLKCFDLSSSGCEESSTSKANSEPSIPPNETSVPKCDLVSVSSAEKCVQTNDVSMTISMDHATDTATENFVVVDGGYLNILFHNLALPQIFSSGKQYEVNEEALRNIVNSANNHNTNISGSDVVEKLMDQIKNKDSDSSSSSASTARSLIEEFDQYYKELNDDNKSLVTCTSEIESYNSSKAYKVIEPNLHTSEIELEQPEEQISQNSSLVTMSSEGTCHDNDPSLQVSDDACVCEAASPVADECSLDKEPVTTSQTPTGPLPVPVGAAAVVDSQPPEVPTWTAPKSSEPSGSETDSVSSQSLCGSVSSIASLSAPVHVEAEELRRQQLAIEREIKALEQQQCRLLVVREIPDKPPPPYTPPTETRTPKPPRMFTPDENLEEKVERYINNAEGPGELTEAFSVFVQDFCLESLERHKHEQSDKPWATCNLMPRKPQVEMTELVEKTSSELKDVLTTVAPTAVSGVSSRRSDHIDDILFCEWRRCEPEWTALHTDEAIVKNQIFESIFQKILTNTIDEYKKTVQGDEVVSD